MFIRFPFGVLAAHNMHGLTLCLQAVNALGVEY